MNRKPVTMIALAGLAVVVFVAWQAVLAIDKAGGTPVLPDAVARAVKGAFPKATIGAVKRERKGVVLYEVVLKQEAGELEVEVAADGQVVEVSRRVAGKDVPEPVARTLKKLAPDAKVKEIEKEEVHAVLKLVKLGKPLVVYEAELVEKGKQREVRIAADGRLLGAEVEADDDDDEDDDEDDENEREVSIDQVPAAVKATILKEAGQNKIEEIEVETRGGKTVYEAEWTAGGKEIEIKVAPDGTLLGKAVEDEDDDDEDDD